MSDQYLRNCSLVVADPTGAGIELGALRVTFTVRRGDTQTPNSCDVAVYNLSDNTVNALRHRGDNEFTQLQLRASYGDQPLALIFYGSITQVRTGREDQRNSYIAITAVDGDEAYNFAPIARTFAAGSTALTAVQGIIAAMAAAASPGSPQPDSTGGQPLTQGFVAQLNPNRTTRGQCLYGTAKDEARLLADNIDCKWFVQEGKFNLVPRTGYIPAPPVVISPGNGLIGIPEQTQNGLELRVLLNPAIKIGQVIKLDSKTINELRFGVDLQSSVIAELLKKGVAKTNTDGLYYVMRADHNGDTRGNNWYTDLTCLAVDAEVPPASAVVGSAVLPANATKRY